MLEQNHRQKEYFKRERDKNISTLIRKGDYDDLKGHVLSNEVHQWCINLIRSPEKRFCNRAECEFSSADDVFRYLQSVVEFDEKCLLFGYNLDKEPSLCLPKNRALRLLENDNVALSLDGFVITNVYVTSCFILDYEDANESGSLARVFCSAIGESALNPQFPGKDKVSTVDRA